MRHNPQKEQPLAHQVDPDGQLGLRNLGHIDTLHFHVILFHQMNQTYWHGTFVEMNLLSKNKRCLTLAAWPAMPGILGILRTEMQMHVGRGSSQPNRLISSLSFRSGHRQRRANRALSQGQLDASRELEPSNEISMVDALFHSSHNGFTTA